MSANFIATPNLPVVTLSATASFVGIGAEFSLPVATLSASMTSGSAFTSSFLLKAPQLTSSLLGGLGFSAAFNLPAGNITAQLIQDAIFSSAPTMPRTVLSAQLSIGGIFTSAPVLPISTLEAVLRMDGTFSAVFTLPRVQLSALLSAIASGTYRTWALNLHNGALTEYDNFDFDSYATFNRQVLACNASGVVVLAQQALDGATVINSVALTGLSDFDGSMHNRVPRLYIDGSQDGDIHFKVLTKEGGSRTYLLPWNRTNEHTQRRVPIGKGPRSRFFQFGIENVGGADFSTKAVLAYPTKLRRRIS